MHWDAVAQWNQHSIAATFFSSPTPQVNATIQATSQYIKSLAPISPSCTASSRHAMFSFPFIIPQRVVPSKRGEFSQHTVFVRRSTRPRRKGKDVTNCDLSRRLAKLKLPPGEHQLLLTKGDNNHVDDIDLYQGLNWLERRHIVGKVRGYVSVKSFPSHSLLLGPCFCSSCFLLPTYAGFMSLPTYLGLVDISPVSYQ